jgi:hypothetical protein
MKRNLIAVIAAGLATGAAVVYAGHELDSADRYWKQPETVVHLTQHAQQGKGQSASPHDDTSPFNSCGCS